MPLGLVIKKRHAGNNMRQLRNPHRSVIRQTVKRRIEVSRPDAADVSCIGPLVEGLDWTAGCRD
jgi:hypothetical protein